MIRWPAHFEPERSPVFVHNELVMEVPPEAVWEWLIRAEFWPSWYSNSRNVVIEDGPRPDLGAGSRFQWWTFGIPLRSSVEEFVPRERLAWRAVGLGVDAYHAWLIEPRNGGCWVLTEETQHGTLARLGNFLMPGRMPKHHQLWLEALERRARQGPPPETDGRR